MNLDDLLTLKALEFKRSFSVPRALAESFIEGQPNLHNVCAKVSEELYQRLDNVCQTLDMSKREFIEAALVEAISLAESKMWAMVPEESK